MEAVEVPLTRGKIALVSPEDAERVLGRKWHVLPARRDDSYAVRTRKDGRKIYMHRVIMGAKEGQSVDHINGNGLDNRRENLRFCTTQQNCANQMPRPSKSGFRGVYKYKNPNLNSPYQAYIRVNHKRYHLGMYPTAEEAARVYDNAAVKHFGEFARLNFPRET